MQITTRQLDDVIVVDMDGRLDLKSVGYGNEEMVRIVNENHKKVLVNLEKLEFMSSAGLRVLLLVSKLLKSSGGELRICSANELVGDVLRTCGFDSLIALYPTEAEALAGF